MDLVFFIQCKKRSMERVMDFPRFGEAELIGDEGEDFDDCKRSFTFGGKFWVGDGAFQVPGLQPNLVAFGKWSESSVVV